MCRRLTGKPRWKARFSGPFFNEFVVSGDRAAAALDRAEKAGVLAGVPLGRWYPELDDAIAIAVTEANLYLPLMIIPIYMSVERMDMQIVRAAARMP